MGELRTPQSMAKYKKFVSEGLLSHGCVLCKAESIKEFENWRIVNNAFPYDRIAKVHHMIITKQHTSDASLTAIEKKEFEVIKIKYLHQTYEWILEATYKKKSVPEHAHLHLIIVKD